MTDELFPFQKVGSLFLRSHNHCLLADEMGLGKTPQAIDACKKLKLKRVLVICPSVAKYNWQKEFQKWGNITPQVAETVQEKLANKAITSFDFFTQNLEWFLSHADWDAVIPDEGHYLKEPSSQRSQAVLAKEGVIHRTKRLWILTGTPAPNHIGEMWVFLKTFGYTSFSYEGFVARYCNTHRAGGHYSRIRIEGTNVPQTIKEIRPLIRKMCLRRYKKDVLKDLPPIFHTTYFIKGDANLKWHPELQKKMETEYKLLAEKLNFNHAVHPDKLLSSLKFLSQSVSSLRRYHGLTKVNPVAELVSDELKRGEYEKIVIFGIHTDVLESLTDALRIRGSGVIKITGSTPSKTRQILVDKFQQDPFTQVLMGNIQAAGTAITLTAAHHVLFIEQDWVPGNNAQAADRCHRIGQENVVTVRHVAIKDSIDEKITGILARKTQELSAFL